MHVLLDQPFAICFGKFRSPKFGSYAWSAFHDELTADVAAAFGGLECLPSTSAPSHYAEDLQPCFLFALKATVQAGCHPCEAGVADVVAPRSGWWICRILDTTRRHYVPFWAHQLLRWCRPGGDLHDAMVVTEPTKVIRSGSVRQYPDSDRGHADTFFFLSSRRCKVTASSLGAHCEDEPPENTFGVFKVILRCQGLSGCEARVFRGNVTMPRTVGKMGFSQRGSQTKQHHTKRWGVQTLAKNIFRPGPSKCLFVVVAPCFCKNGVFSRSHTFFTETTENVVPKWQWQKTVFAPEGLKEAILAVAAEGARYMSHSVAPYLPFTFNNKEELFSFSCVLVS